MKFVYKELEKLIDIFDKQRIPLSSIEREKKKGEYPYYGASGIIDYVDEYIFDGEYVLVSEDGENLRSRKTPIIFKAKGKFWVNNHAHIIKGKENILNDNYLIYVFNNTNISGYITGAAQPKLTQENLCRISIPLPEKYCTQQKIAKILSNYDDLIENNNKRIKILEEMAQKIYKELFVDFKYPGHETVAFKDTELGKIPSDWKVAKIGSEFETVLGGTPSRNNLEYWGGKIPWLSSRKTNELRIITESEFITELGLKKSSTKLMPKYTTLLAITGATLGQVSMIGTEMCANQSVVGIINNKYQEFIFYMVKNNISNLISKAGGAAQQHINKDIVNDMPFIMPKNSVLENFETIVKPINDEIFTLLYKNKTLQKIRDSLLPRLMSGEISVENLEIA